MTLTCMHLYNKINVFVCVCVCVCTQSCPALCDPMDCSPPSSSVCGIFQAIILEGIAIFLLQGIFLTQGLHPHPLCLLNCRFFTH